MTLRLLHVSDLHFGGHANVPLIETLEKSIPGLRPDAIIVSGDLSQRARHGEFQRARAFVTAASEVAPVYVLPGNHDVSWWWRPLGPFGSGLLYRKYRRYFGPDLTPILRLPRAVIAGVLTSDGAAWGSPSCRVRDLAAKGHLSKAEYLRVRGIFTDAAPHLIRVLVVHHNVVRGERSGMRGLAHARRAMRRIAASGAELVLCGHDHHEAAHLVDGRVVVSTAGTLSARLRGGVPSFNVVAVESTVITITFYRWLAESEQFRASLPLRFDRSHSAEVA